MGRRTRVIQVAAFAALLLLATLALLELGAAAGFALLDDWPSRASIESSLDTADEPETTGDAPATRRRSSVLHPYLGFVRDPVRLPRRVNRRLPDAAINEFGFFGPSPMAAKGANVARVVITGGSVAEEFFLYAGEALARELEASGAFGGRSVELVSLAMAGFKQPQQLIAVSYLLLLGAEFDAIVNLDGFNEVVLPFTDIVPMKVAPSYPFRWNALAIDTIDVDTAQAVAQIGETLTALESWRGFFGRVPLRHSAFALASWHAVSTQLEAKRVRLEGVLREKLAASAHSRPSLRGPTAEFASDDRIHQASVELWKRASIQLWQLCQAQHIAYLHALQPNQYVAGSKPFTPAERTIAIRPSGNTTRIAAEAGYIRMIAEGANLREMGLPFFDLTDLFEHEAEPVYRDGCCHYYDRGYELIADRIARELAAR